MVMNCRTIIIALSLLLFATVALSQDITVNNNLIFGSVFSGVPKSISKKSPGEAAEFHISGTANAEISIDFSLQTYMHTNGANMRLDYSNIDCAMDSSASPDQTNPDRDNLNPWQSLTYRLGSTGLTIWLGGTVTPGLVQKPGDYTGMITLTVAYTGN
jgi:hypothetical protein